jgi:hypothetical protein
MFFASRLLAAAFALISQHGARINEAPFKAIGQMSGADSTIEIAKVVVITNQEDWVQLWRAHRQSFQVGLQKTNQDDSPDRPKVDFRTTAILCLFGGQSKNVGGFHVVDSGQSGNDAYVRVEPNLLPQSGTTILQNAYIFVTVPKTARKIIVQLDQSSLGGQGWRTLATVPPTKD